MFLVAPPGIPMPSGGPTGRYINFKEMRKLLSFVCTTLRNLLTCTSFDFNKVPEKMTVEYDNHIR